MTTTANQPPSKPPAAPAPPTPPKVPVLPTMPETPAETSMPETPPVAPPTPEPSPPPVAPEPPTEPPPAISSTPEPPEPTPPEEEKKSFSLVFVLLGLLIILGAVGAGAYYLGYLPTEITSLLSQPSPSPVEMASPSPMLEELPEPSPISTDDSLETIEKELNETVIDDFSQDLKEIEKEAEGL